MAPFAKGNAGTSLPFVFYRMQEVFLSFFSPRSATMEPVPLERWMKPSEWSLLYGFSPAQVKTMIEERELPVLETSQGSRVLDIGWDLVLDARRHRRNIDDLPILRTTEVAELLNMGTRAIMSLRCSKKLRYTTDASGGIRFSVNQVRQYLWRVQPRKIRQGKWRKSPIDPANRIRDWAAKKLAQELAPFDAPA